MHTTNTGTVKATKQNYVENKPQNQKILCAVLLASAAATCSLVAGTPEIHDVGRVVSSKFPCLPLLTTGVYFLHNFALLLLQFLYLLYACTEYLISTHVLKDQNYTIREWISQRLAACEVRW